MTLVVNSVARRFMVRLTTSLSFVIAFASVHADDFSDQLPRLPPLSPTEAIKAMQVVDGFHIELAASEPNIGTPVEICWDAKGRMFVCEMRGYSELRDEKLSRISRLEDLDGDGFYESAKVFADDLFWPTAILPYRDGVFVADAPNIFFIRDTNGDGVGDRKQTVLTGFGTQNVQGLLNSLRWGLDNRIHVACSSNGGRIHHPDRPHNAIEVRGRDLAFDPETFAFSLTNGGGQNGMSFDDWGNKYASSNSDHLQAYIRTAPIPSAKHLLKPARSRVSIADDGPQAEVFRLSPTESWRIVRTNLRVIGSVPGPVEGGGRAAGYFTGATGATIYRGDAWPIEHHGLAFVGDVGSNLVHRKRIHQADLRPAARRIDAEREFIASTDNWFRPAQFANGPDGNLHIVDVCREVIEHPKSLPPEIKRHLDLNSGRELGRVFRVVANGSLPRRHVDLSSEPTLTLATLLSHPNSWHRETAARLLFERQDETATARLTELALNAPAPLTRVHARHSLNGLAGLTADILDRGILDSSPQVRLHSIRLAAASPDYQFSAASLASLSTDPSIEVRFELSLHLGHLANHDRLEILPGMIRRDIENPWLAAAFLAATQNDLGHVFADLYQDPKFDSPSAQCFLQALALEMESERAMSDHTRVIKTMLQDQRRSVLFQYPILRAVHRVTRFTSELPSAQQDAQLLEQLETRLRNVEQQLRNRLTDRNVPKDELIAVIRCLGNSSSPDTITAIDNVLSTSRVADVRSAAIDALSNDASDAAGKALIDRWNNLGTQQRRIVINKMWTRSNHQEMIVAAIDQGRLSSSDLARNQWSAGLKSPSSRVTKASQRFLDENPPIERGLILAEYRDVLTMDGDPTKGKSVFEKSCSTCHRLDQIGNEIGPNLSAFAARGAAPILVNVLDPNREINPQYLNYTALTVDGRVVAGMIRSEDNDSIMITTADGKATTIPRDEIEQLQNTGVSFMPEGFEDSITPQAMSDLIAYLTSR